MFSKKTRLERSEGWRALFRQSPSVFLQKYLCAARSGPLARPIQRLWFCNDMMQQHSVYLAGFRSLEDCTITTTHLENQANYIDKMFEQSLQAHDRPITSWL